MDSGPDLYAMSFRPSCLMRVFCALLSSTGPVAGLEDGVVVIAVELAEGEIATGAEPPLPRPCRCRHGDPCMMSLLIRKFVSQFASYSKSRHDGEVTFRPRYSLSLLLA